MHNEHLKPRLVWLNIDKVDEQVFREEKDAKVDIYNYAARFNAIPEIIEQSKRRGSKSLYMITVKLPEQNIEVKGTGKNLRFAEIAAALRFKEAAEKYQAEHGDQPLIINDSTTLNHKNSRQFLDFYRAIHPSASIEVKHHAPEGATEEDVKMLISRGIVSAQVALDGGLIGQAVSMQSKHKAAQVAALTAAIELCKAEPDLFPEFIRALAVGNGEILTPLHPITLVIDEDCQLTMQETLLSARKAGLSEEVEDDAISEQENENRSDFRRQLSPSQTKRRSRELLQRLGLFTLNPKFAEPRKQRGSLPVNEHRPRVRDLISNSTYSIIIGATGSGKTTQVPQIILEDAIIQGKGASCNVICTQPRRIAATSVARRVAAERAERLQDTVGYHVRFDAKLPSHGGSITYCTTGVLLQQLQHQPDEVMEGISHIVIDEVHERDLLIDFLLILLKKVMSQRAAAGKSTPKVVLMSATMDTELFASYFGTEIEGKGMVGCPSLSVPGRTFPVKEMYLDEIVSELSQASPEASSLVKNDPTTVDYLKVEREFQDQCISLSNRGLEGASLPSESTIDWKSEYEVDVDGNPIHSKEVGDSIIPFGLVSATITHISKTTDDGAILVFLPGLEEMMDVERSLFTSPLGVDFNDSSKYKVYLLHSSIPSAQTDVFNEVPAGCRKIILSTNIAETSITIPDVKYVVDSGKSREKQYDHSRGISYLKCTWISKTNAKQRAGRAGRVQNGNYYALYSNERYSNFRVAKIPQMQSLDLLEVCLDIKAQKFDYPIRDFLAEAIEPPSANIVDVAIKNLQALGAITAEEEITPLGRLLASLPIHPSLGKMILLGVIFRCLDPMLIISIAVGDDNLFTNSVTRDKEVRRIKSSFTRGTASDHLNLLNAFCDMRQTRDSEGEFAMRQWAMQNYIHINQFKIIDRTAKQIEQDLTNAGLIPPREKEWWAPKSSEYGHPSLNENSSNIPLIKALLVAGLHPNLSVSIGGRTHRTPGEARTSIHPHSVNHSPRVQDTKTNTLHAYGSMARSGNGKAIFLRETTECTPLQAALFGGSSLTTPTETNVLEMDHWLPFFVRSNAGNKRAARTIVDFRQRLDRLLGDAWEGLGRSQRLGGGAGGKYLADDAARSAFAEGLVRVLERDEEVWREWEGGRTERERIGRRKRWEREREKEKEKEERKASPIDEVKNLGSRLLDDLGVMAGGGGKGSDGRR